MSMPSIDEVRELAARCAAAGDAELEQGFEERFGMPLQRFCAMEPQQQVAYLQGCVMYRGAGANNEQVKGAIADFLQALGFASIALKESDVDTVGKLQSDSLFLTPSIPQTQTEAFKRWFGDSKVVNEKGEPLVVYRGTTGNFKVFAEEQIGTGADEVSNMGDFGDGFYFTINQADASKYAGEENGANVMPVYLSIKNPIDAGELMNIEGVDGMMQDPYPGESLRSLLEALGYDGILVNGGEEIVAFRPEQIKSAIGNSGSFDPNSQDITDGAGREFLKSLEKANVKSVECVSAVFDM